MNLYDHIRAALAATDGNQRFLLTGGCAFMCSIHLQTHVLSETGFVTLVLGTVGVFVGAGTAEKFSQNKANSQIEVAKATGVNPPAPAVIVTAPPAAVITPEAQK